MSKFDELKKIYDNYLMGENPDSMNILSFISEFDDTFKINLLDYEIEKITSIEYLTKLLEDKNGN